MKPSYGVCKQCGGKLKKGEEEVMKLLKFDACVICRKKRDEQAKLLASKRT